MKAAKIYKEKHQVIALNNKNREADYRRTSQFHQSLAEQNMQAKTEREQYIR